MYLCICVVNWEEEDGSTQDGGAALYLCICECVYLCMCVFVNLCICVFVYLCIYVFVCSVKLTGG